MGKTPKVLAIRKQRKGDRKLPHLVQSFLKLLHLMMRSFVLEP